MKIEKSKYYIDRTCNILTKVTKIRGSLVYYVHIVHKHSDNQLNYYHKTWYNATKKQFAHLYRPISKLEHTLKFGDLK